MINLNGHLLSEEEASIPLSNRGFAYGDSVFETLRVINGKIIFWEEHYFRLMSSMRLMRMEIPLNFSPEFLEEKIIELIGANSFQKDPSRVKLTVYRKDGGFYTPNTNDIGYSIAAELLYTPFYLFKDSGRYEVELFKDHYLNSGILSSIKTNNRALNVLGSIYAKENGYNNCLLLNENKNVVEALNGNLFLVKGNTIKTPPISEGCIRGIIRVKIIEIVNQLKEFEFLEEPISPFELQKADELFITNVIVGIQPIDKYRKKVFDHKVSKELLTKLNVKARLEV